MLGHIRSVAIVLLAVVLLFLFSLRGVKTSGQVHILDQRVTAHGVLEVREIGGYREMVIRAENEMVWTRQHSRFSLQSGFRYLDAQVACVPKLAKRVLVLGLGGGLAVKKLMRRCRGCQIDVVEIDPGVVQMARDYFGFPTCSQVSVHVADAVEFLLEERDTWDAVLIDVYDSSDVPHAFLRESFWCTVARCLSQGGRVSVNVIENSRGDNRRLQLVAVLRRVGFDVGIVYSGELVQGRRNVVLSIYRPFCLRRG